MQIVNQVLTQIHGISLKVIPEMAQHVGNASILFKRVPGHEIRQYSRTHPVTTHHLFSLKAVLLARTAATGIQ